MGVFVHGSCDRVVCEFNVGLVDMSLKQIVYLSKQWCAVCGLCRSPLILFDAFHALNEFENWAIFYVIIKIQANGFMVDWKHIGMGLELTILPLKYCQ